MKIAVTGATGFVGRYLVRRLVADGHACRCWYRESGSLQGFDDISQQVEWTRGELGDRQASAKLLRGCDAVSRAVIHGRQTSAKNQIVTDKLRSLGMTFGGQELFEQTIRHLVDAART